MRWSRITGVWVEDTGSLAVIRFVSDIGDVAYRVVGESKHAWRFAGHALARLEANDADKALRPCSRLANGRTMTIDVTGYENVPAVGAQVTAFYYDGYLLRATRPDGKLLATTWAPAYRWLHGLAGIALIGAAGLAVVHRLRTSPRRSQPILTWLIPYDGAA